MSLSGLVIGLLCAFFFTTVNASDDNGFLRSKASAEVYHLIEMAGKSLESGHLDSATSFAMRARDLADGYSDTPDTTTASILEALASCHLERSDLAAAGSLFVRALALREAQLAESDPRIAIILSHMCRLRYDQGRYEEGMEIARRALAIRKNRPAPYPLEVAASLHDVARGHHYRGMHATAESLFVQALDLRESALGPDHVDLAIPIKDLGLLYLARGKTDLALQYLKRALLLAETKLPAGHPIVATVQNGMAHVYRTTGKYSAAESLYVSARAIRLAIYGSDHLLVGEMHYSLARLNWVMGRYAAAEPLHNQALSIREKRLDNNHPDIGASLNDLGALYWHQSRFAEAKSIFERSLAIHMERLGPNHPTVGSVLNNLSVVYRKLGQYEEAEHYQQRALDLRLRTLGPRHPKVAMSQMNLGNLYRFQGMYENGEPLLKQALSTCREVFGETHVRVAMTLFSLGALYLGQGNWAEAEIHLKRALVMYEEVVGPEFPEVASCLQYLGRLYAGRGDFEQSVDQFERWIRLRRQFVDHAFSLSSEDRKLQWLEKYPVIDDSFLTLAISHGDTRARSLALEMVLGGKGIVTDAVMAEREYAYCSLDDAILESVERHAEVGNQIANLAIRGLPGVPQEQYRDSLKALYTLRNALETELSISCSVFGADLLARRFSIEDISASLPEQTILLEYMQYDPYEFNTTGPDEDRTGPSRYAVFCLQSEGQISFIDIGPVAHIDSLVALARVTIYESGPRIFSPAAADMERRLKEITGSLYDLLLSPVAEHLRESKELYVSPDGMLNLLPFEILPDADGTYLIERHQICYLSAGRDLLRAKESSESRSSAIIISDPDFDYMSAEAEASNENSTEKFLSPRSSENSPWLVATDCLNARFDPIRYSRQEATQIARSLLKVSGMTVIEFAGAEATEIVLKNLTNPPRVLHIATHGYFCEIDADQNSALFDNPLLRSGLALAGSNRTVAAHGGSTAQMDDGILTALEISGLNLSGTELVTLSACETGLGELVQGEGVFGLRRAFQHAGAQSLVMSLWAVPDKETSELMENFYDRWVGGERKLEALRNAALDLLHKSREELGHTHPMLWGGFVLVGNPD